jgi:hypothetical protein
MLSSEGCAEKEIEDVYTNVLCNIADVMGEKIG